MRAFEPHNFEDYHDRLMAIALAMLKPLIGKRLAKVRRCGRLPPAALASAMPGIRLSFGGKGSNSLLNQSDPAALPRGIRTALEHALRDQPNVFMAVANELRKQRHKLDVLLQSPPPARPAAKPRKRKAKLPLREQRAADARCKLREWERKQKVAVTKIKAYRRKVRRYESIKSKGESNDT